MCGITGKDFNKIKTIQNSLEKRFGILKEPNRAYDNECESEFFDIKFYKKGTIHIKFKNKDDWEKFNTTAAKGKMWLGNTTK
jgi:hypothetical protein